jgi:glutathione S-transferase
MTLVLHGCWRASAADRVRIALNLKSLAYQQATVDLRTVVQRSADYRELAAIGLVPTLEANGFRITEWVARWIGEGFTALEIMTSEHGGTFCFGDRPSIADCCPIYQVCNARRFDVDLNPFAKLVAIEAGCLRLDAFEMHRPELQPDGDGGSA